MMIIPYIMETKNVWNHQPEVKKTLEKTLVTLQN